MKIKTKLILGVGLLFAMIVLLTVLSSIYINRLSNDTKNILIANYNSIEYSRQMINALNDGITNPNSNKSFSENLEKQNKNNTETGEKELTEKVVYDFKILLENPSDSSIQYIIRKDLSEIMLLNMQAIQNKSKIAETTANTAITWISVTGSICFIIAFVLLFNLPSNIANPIKELTESIKQIASKNYSERVHFESNSEFGQLAKSFNTMAKKLEEYSNSDLERLMMAKQRIEILINNMREPVIGLDELNNILFMNETILKIAGLKKEEVIGENIETIANKNDLISALIQNESKSEIETVKQKPSSIKIFADNKESYFEKEVIPIKIIPTGEETERNIGKVILLQNITTYKELDFAKNNFIATISHELKTPISAIKMSVQLLENNQIGVLNLEQQNLINSIKEDTVRLLKITSELLNMTQVESGSIQINLVPCNALDIVDYAINATKMMAEQKQISIKINIGNNLPKVLADTEKTAWVLTNLLSNAIRYTYEKSII
ncbi:MAG: HAMP domain-containing protein, partial [Chitinophagaceae bacterium]